MTKTRRALVEKTNLIKTEMAEKTKSVRQKELIKKSTVQARTTRSNKENATEKPAQKIQKVKAENSIDKKSETSRTRSKENNKKNSPLESPKITKPGPKTSLNNYESVSTKSNFNLDKSIVNVGSLKVKDTSPIKSAVKSGVPKNEPKRLVTRSKSGPIVTPIASDRDAKNVKNLIETQKLTPKSAQKVLNVSLTRSSEMEEKIRQQARNKPLKVNSCREKILNISLTYDPIVEQKISQKFPRQASQKAKKLLQTLQNSPDTDSPKKSKSPEKKGTPDIYEFTFDPTEEKEFSKKRKLKQILENSGDLNNSMKEVVQRIRKKEFKTKISKASGRAQKRVGVKPKKGKSKKGSPQKNKNEFSPILKNLEPFDPHLETKGPKPKTRNSEIISKKGTLGPQSTTLGAQNSTLGAKNSTLGAQNLTPGAPNSTPSAKNSKLGTPKSQNTNLRSQHIPRTSEIDKNSRSIVQKSDSFEVGPISETIQNESVISQNSVMNLENLTLPESIIQSFCGDDTEISPQKFYPSPRKSALGSKSPRINIISNEVVQKGSETKWNELKTGDVRQNLKKANIAKDNDNSNPWRLNVVNRNPHTFVVKNTNFTPSYDQDIVINSTLVEKIAKSTPKVINSPSKEPNFQQTSILDFVNSPRHLNTTLFMSPVKDRTKIAPGESPRPLDSPTKVATPKKLGSSKNNDSFDQENVQTESKSKTSPKKVLGEFNFQSTPYNKNMEKLDLDISRIQTSNRKSPNNRKTRQTLFGFSFDENSKENIEERNLNCSKNFDVVKSKGKNLRGGLKEILPSECLDNELMETRVTGKGGKKKSLKKVLFNEDKNENLEKRDESEINEDESENLEVAPSELDMLFQDPEDEVEKRLEVKKSRFSYERRLKRKRYPSWNESEAENESEDEEGGDKKNTPKKHNKTKTYKRTKQEDEEIDKLAAHYNSMFEEIEEHDLLVE